MSHSFVVICHHIIFLHLDGTSKTSDLLPKSNCCFHSCIFTHLNSIIKPLLRCISLNHRRMLIQSKRICIHVFGLQFKLLNQLIGQENSYIEVNYFLCNFRFDAARMDSKDTNLTYLWFVLTFDIEDGTSTLSWEGRDAMNDLFFPISDLNNSSFLFDSSPLIYCLHCTTRSSRLIF